MKTSTVGSALCRKNSFLLRSATCFIGNRSLQIVGECRIDCIIYYLPEWREGLIRNNSFHGADPVLTGIKMNIKSISHSISLNIYLMRSPCKHHWVFKWTLSWAPGISKIGGQWIAVSFEALVKLRFHFLINFLFEFTFNSQSFSEIVKNLRKEYFLLIVKGIGITIGKLEGLKNNIFEADQIVIILVIVLLSYLFWNCHFQYFRWG